MQKHNRAKDLFSLDHLCFETNSQNVVGLSIWSDFWFQVPLSLSTVPFVLIDESQRENSFCLFSLLFLYIFFIDELQMVRRTKLLYCEWHLSKDFPFAHLSSSQFLLVSRSTSPSTFPVDPQGNEWIETRIPLSSMYSLSCPILSIPDPLMVLSSSHSPLPSVATASSSICLWVGSDDTNVVHSLSPVH